MTKGALQKKSKTKFFDAMARNNPLKIRQKHALSYSKVSNVRDDTRRHLAYLAARLIAEEGVSDYAAARQKAAHQAGITEAQGLPQNDEIEAALREYQQLFKSDHQPLQLRLLREIALDLMRVLGEFNPYLVGAALRGTATEFSGIELQVFADDCKNLELFLINRRIAYHTNMRRTKLGGKEIQVPILDFEFGGVPVSIAVYATNNVRIKTRAGARHAERANLVTLERLLASE